MLTRTVLPLLCTDLERYAINQLIGSHSPTYTHTFALLTALSPSSVTNQLYLFSVGVFCSSVHMTLTIYFSVTDEKR
jgi:hypothetical protein